MKKISSKLSTMKTILYGDSETDKEIKEEENSLKLCQNLFASNLLLELLRHIQEFEFEARKDVAHIYNYILRHQASSAVHYIKEHKEIISMLVVSYNNADIVLPCGSILRAVIRHEPLHELLLNIDTLDAFFHYVQLPAFDVSSDAFATFRMLLTTHKELAARFLAANFENVFTKYNLLLKSGNYVTKRQSLKFLSELLLCRQNFTSMMRYIGDRENLKIVMNLLSDASNAIQLEAFQLFNIFVMNPKKTLPVVEILVHNREKIVKFLGTFQSGSQMRVAEEKQNLIEVLGTLVIV